MQILNYSQARASLKTVMEDVCRDSEPTIITRQTGKPVVMLSLDDYNGIQETLYLLSSRKNAERLLTSVAKIKNGKAFQRALINETSESDSQ